MLIRLIKINNFIHLVSSVNKIAYNIKQDIAENGEYVEGMTHVGNV